MSAIQPRVLHLNNINQLPHDKNPNSQKLGNMSVSAGIENTVQLTQ